ncbi:MAG: Ig-like domain-containing protein [Halobacteriota archaeon]|nr:Ig-like domain-containing protein [Halobacteriota archaeon]
MINGTEVQTDTSVTEASYTNASAATGIWNISAIATNENGTYMQTWIWNVTSEPDTTPPSSITNLQNTKGITWINWTWTNPINPDFSHVMIYLDGVWQENTSEQSFNATGLSADTEYEIGTCTVDSSGNINQTWVNQTAKTSAIPDTTPPIITNVTATDITSNSATITWDTDEASDSLVKYGTESGNYMQQKYNLINVTSHSVDLTGLMPGTTYYFVVNSTDLSENSNESEEYNFTTEQTIQPYKISLSVGQRRITADGMSNTTITAQLKDEEGNDVNLRSVPINFTTTRGKLSDTSAVTDENGTATVTLSSTSRRLAIIRASSESVERSGRTWVWFRRG